MGDIGDIPSERLALSPSEDTQLTNPQVSGLASGLSTPSVGRAPPLWLLASDATLANHDTEVVAHFLDMFCSNIAHDFTTFQSFDFCESTLPAVILAMAAVGGLYFRTQGTFEVAAAFYNHARRMTYSLVSLRMLNC